MCETDKCKSIKWSCILATIERIKFYNTNNKVHGTNGCFIDMSKSKESLLLTPEICYFFVKDLISEHKDIKRYLLNNHLGMGMLKLHERGAISHYILDKHLVLQLIEDNAK